MKTINLFVIECSSEEEDYVYYFDGKGTKEQFEKDVKECVRKILNENYKFIKVDEKTYVRRRAINNDNVKKFIEWVRNVVGYDGKIYVDVDGSFVEYTTAKFEDDLYIEEFAECPVEIFADTFMGKIDPHRIIGSKEFIECMKKKGWEEVNIESKGSVWFYEWGGFVEGEDGKWYNHVWNFGYKEI